MALFVTEQPTPTKCAGEEKKKESTIKQEGDLSTDDACSEKNDSKVK